ncbi:MAG: hypothetical protein IEMM0002_0331 [bacterium]|nr:MAG: hypothetical protein IEMM0002_0331 [bacterium]
MKTAISIPDRIFIAAEQAARRSGVSRSKLYAIAVEEYLKAHRSESVTEKLNEVYCKKPFALDAALSRMQSASIPPEEW